MPNDFSSRPSQLMAPLLVSLFHKSKAAILEFRGQGLGAILRDQGYRLVPFPTGPVAHARHHITAIATGPFVSYAGALQAAWLSCLAAERSGPGYLALVESGERAARMLMLRPHFIRNIPAVTVRRNLMKDRARNALGMTMQGTLIISPSLDEIAPPPGVPTGRARRLIEAALMAEVARLTDSRHA